MVSLSQYDTLIDKDYNEMESFKKYRKGLVSLDYIIAQYYKLAIHIAKKFNNITFIQEEDKISIAIVGLIKSIEKFDENKGIKFATFSSRIMENEILMEIRKFSKARGFKISNLEDDLAKDFDGKTLKLADVVPYDFNLVEYVEEKILFQEIMDILNTFSERDQKIIKLKFFQNMTLRDIAAELNISHSYVSRLEKRIITNLKNKYKLSKTS